LHKKNTAVASGVSECPWKGMKGEKEIGHSKLVSRAQSPEERECRRESVTLGPSDTFVTGRGELLRL